MPAISETFRVRSYDTDSSGALTAPRLVGYLLEAARISADSLGFGISDLQQRGLTWVLGRLRVVLDEPIRWGDSIEVTTWPSGLVRSSAWREFRLARKGQQVGRSSSIWFVIDLGTRTVVAPETLFPEDLRAAMPHEMPLGKSVPALAGSPTVERTYEVRSADIDLNRHVTATSYVEWAMEAVPEHLRGTRRLASLDVQYVEECHRGDRIVSSSLEDGEDRIHHSVARARDGQELARLETCWAPCQDDVSGVAPRPR